MSFLNYEKIYLSFLGALHGFTNLGGSLLSVIVFSKDMSKESKRSTVAICYLSMALVQVFTLVYSGSIMSIFSISNYIYWIVGILTFLTTEKLFFKIEEKSYIKYCNTFLFIIGIVLIVKDFTKTS